MPYNNTIQTYFVSGKVYLRPYGASAAYEFPGLVDTISLGITEQVISLQDRTQPGGGNYDQLRRIESASMTMNLREFRPSILARTLFGEHAAVNAGTAVGEEHVATLGGFIPLAHPGPYENVTVTDDATSPGSIAQAGNYEVVPGGIQILEDAADIEDDDGLVIGYDYPAYVRVQALTTGAPELEMWFVGQNEARASKQVRVRLHKVRLGAAAEKQLLSADDYGALSVTGEVLKDTTVVAAGASQFFYEDYVS